MAGLNKIQIIGNVGRDPEMRYTSSGRAVTSFSVAVNRRWNDRDGTTRDETLWFRVSAWERLAEICNQYLSKGKQVYIEGRMQQPSVFVDRNGESRAGLEITATEMVMLGSKGDSGYVSDDDYGDERDESAGRGAAPARSSGGGSGPAPARNQPQPVREEDMENEDDLPF